MERHVDWHPDPADPTKALRVPTAEEWVGKCRAYAARRDVMIDLNRERDALAAELAAMRGEAAPDGWEWRLGGWKARRDVQGVEVKLYVGNGGHWSCKVFTIEGGYLHTEVLGEGRADRLTGPDGAFEQAEAAAKGAP